MRKQYLCAKECAEQRTVAQYMALRPHLNFFHVPNERPNETERIQQALLGTQPGIPDNFILTRFKRNGVTYTGVVSELKRAHASRSKVSKAQREWLERLKQEGAFTAVCYGSREFIELIEWAYGPMKA